MDAYRNLGGLGPFCNKWRWGGGGGGVGREFFFGKWVRGLVQKKKSPDFRRPEVGISVVRHWSAWCEKGYTELHGVKPVLHHGECPLYH